MNSIILSFIVPVFNTEISYLKKCFSPFIIHTDKRLELIVVDDGSDSTTAFFLEQYLPLLKVKYQLIHQKNCGQNSARNTGIENSNGRYVGFLDSDDLIEWKSLKKSLDILTDLDSDIVAFGVKEVDQKGNLIRIRNLSFDQVDSLKIKSYLLSCCQELWSFFLNKRCLAVNRPLYEGASIGEDLVSLFAFICNAKSFYIIDQIFYQYRSRSSSIMNTANVYQRLSIIYAFSQLIISLDKELFRDYYYELEWQAIYHILYVESGNFIKSNIRHLKYAKLLQLWVRIYFPNWKKNVLLARSKISKSISFKLITNNHLFLFGILWKIRLLLKQNNV